MRKKAKNQEEDDKEDGVDDAEPVERAKGKSRGKLKRVALGRGGGVDRTI